MTTAVLVFALTGLVVLGGLVVLVALLDPARRDARGRAAALATRRDRTRALLEAEGYHLEAAPSSACCACEEPTFAVHAVETVDVPVLGGRPPGYVSSQLVYPKPQPAAYVCLRCVTLADDAAVRENEIGLETWLGIRSRAKDAVARRA